MSKETTRRNAPPAGKCRFSTRNYCTGLSATKCDGMNTDCKFFMTEQQFIDSRDSAILLNRAKGNCADCKYVKMPCKCSFEANSNEFIGI